MGTGKEKKFRELTLGERHRLLKEEYGLSKEQLDDLLAGGIRYSKKDRPAENGAGKVAVPLKFAENFTINGKEFSHIPMSIEESSVVAAASNAAKMAKRHGGFTAISTEQVMMGQIMLMNVPDEENAKNALRKHILELEAKAKELAPHLAQNGGGLTDVKFSAFETDRGRMLVAEFLIDCKDAAGMNAVNKILEGSAPQVEALTGGDARARIISNYSPTRLAMSHATFDKDALAEGGPYSSEETVERMLDVYHWALNDVGRAVTHNKGIMNGIDAVALATGQDWRALEAGAHAYAATQAQHTGKNNYGPLTKLEKDADGNLVAGIQIPLAVGIVGGSSQANPVAKMSIEKFLKAESAGELAEIMASVGLANNVAAIRAIACEGIQQGHMKLHGEMLHEKRDGKKA